MFNMLTLHGPQNTGLLNTTIQVMLLLSAKLTLFATTKHESMLKNNTSGLITGAAFFSYFYTLLFIKGSCNEAQ
jgi:hypothetical protein